MTEYPRQLIFAQSDVSGFILLGLFFLAVFSVGSILRFYIVRRSKRNVLKDFRRYGVPVRGLRPSEQIRIKDYFRREVVTRHLEGYHGRDDDVKSDIFHIFGDAGIHKVDTLRGTTFSYITISGL